LKYLEQIEDDDANEFQEKISHYSLAEEKFNRAISLFPSHAETLYQLALLKLERWNLIKEEASSPSPAPEEIHNIEQMLLQIVANDTSRRGETTGHAHRALATLYLQHFFLFLPSHHNSYLSLVKKSLMHLERTRDILSSHSTELDLYFFEYCEAFNTFWETCWMTQPGPCDHNEVTIIQDCFSIFKETIDSCLSFPSCSSGLVDRDVYLLYGTFLNNFCEFVTTTVTITSPFYDHLRSDAFGTFLHDVVVESIRSVFGTLCFLGNFSWDDSSDSLVEKERRGERPPDEVVENIECLSLSGDLMRSLLEIWDWKSECSSLPTPVCNLENIYHDSSKLIHLRIWIRVILRAHHSHSSSELLFGNFCSLGEDFMFLGSLIDRHQLELEISKFTTSFDGNLLSLLQQERSFGEASLPPFHLLVHFLDLSNLDSSADLTCQLYESSKSSFLIAVAVYGSQSREDQVKGQRKQGKEHQEEEEDVIEVSDYCTLLYNLVCVCWKLHQSDECEGYLRNYIQSLSALKNCQQSEIIDEVMTEIQRDKDIVGFFESEICDRVRHQLPPSSP
jgi:hypothetical protein